MIEIPDENSSSRRVRIPDYAPLPIRHLFPVRRLVFVSIIVIVVFVVLIYFALKPGQPQSGWATFATINQEVDFYGQWYYEDDDMNFVAMVATGFQLTPTHVPLIANKNPDFIFDVYTSASSSATAPVKFQNRANTFFVMLPDQSIGRFRLPPGEAHKLQQVIRQSPRNVSLLRTLLHAYTGPDQGKLADFLDKYHEPPNELIKINTAAQSSTSP